MFENCTNLETAVGSDVYTTYTPGQEFMFDGCNKLTTPLLYCEIPAAFGGIGYCAFTIVNSTSVTPKWTVAGSALQYKLGDAGWANCTNGISIETNDVIQFRGSGRASLFENHDGNNRWIIEGNDVILSGNLNTVLNYNNIPSSIGNNAFNNMFSNCTSITSVSDRFLPATSIAPYCYEAMFAGCTNLVNSPALPAMSLTNNCYQNMFNGCGRLINLPVLPAMTLASYCYNGMFSGCNNEFLIDMPALPAMTLAPNCYQSMFAGCHNLINLSDLPAMSLATNCYQNMFWQCFSIRNPMSILPAMELFSGCYDSMFNSCWGLPIAPELPATTLVDGCYTSMFTSVVDMVTAPNANVYITYTPAQGGMFLDCYSLRYPIPLDEIPPEWR
jgi:hypothetical protein